MKSRCIRSMFCICCVWLSKAWKWKEEEKKERRKMLKTIKIMCWCVCVRGYVVIVFGCLLFFCSHIHICTQLDNNVDILSFPHTSLFHTYTMYDYKKLHTISRVWVHIPQIHIDMLRTINDHDHFYTKWYVQNDYDTYRMYYDECSWH